ncbi:MAG TPA: TonB C-terminal domain-containing protein [Candidatus Limnocylindrales bacterium]|nr:TonB C-terminal domain-containing protein [Candidatus Limnocylindrales bacterium]
MISRTLVPVDVRPPSPDDLRKTARRTTTYMDDRTVVPPELSDAPPLDGKSSIPSHLPLGVLVDRTLVPRGMPAKPIEKLVEAAQYNPIPIAILDSRVVVPAYVERATPEEIRDFEKPHEFTPELREVVEPDIFTTGDANLLIATEGKRNPKNDALVRVASVIVHIGLVVFLIFSPRIFPPHVPTREEMELARQQLSFVYMPPEVSKPALPPGPRIHIDPKTLNKIAPPVFAPPAPSAPRVQTPPEQPAPELPSAPTPRVPVAPAPSQPAPKTAPSELEPIHPQPQGHLNLNLGSSSPNKGLQDELQDAINHRGGSVYTAPGGGIPRGGGGGGGGRGSQPGNGQLQLLTPTDGVDFGPYINRLIATVRRNWYAVMPESAYMGEKGIVTLTFRINQDGSVPAPDPILERTSGREPLDNAAMSSIRMSNPFEPLPSQFKRPYIELRFIFFYNLPVDYAQ